MSNGEFVRPRWQEHSLRQQCDGVNSTPIFLNLMQAMQRGKSWKRPISKSSRVFLADNPNKMWRMFPQSVVHDTYIVPQQQVGQTVTLSPTKFIHSSCAHFPRVKWEGTSETKHEFFGKSHPFSICVSGAKLVKVGDKSVLHNGGMDVVLEYRSTCKPLVRSLLYENWLCYKLSFTRPNVAPKIKEFFPLVMWLSAILYLPHGPPTLIPGEHN